MKRKERNRIIAMVAGVSIGIFVASQFAMPSTRMAVFAASQYIQEFISFR